MGCYIWYSEEGPGRDAAPPSFLLAVRNVTVHPSTASVPITVLLYDGPLICSFNVAVDGLNQHDDENDDDDVRFCITLDVRGWKAWSCMQWVSNIWVDIRFTGTW